MKKNKYVFPLIFFLVTLISLSIVEIFFEKNSSYFIFLIVLNTLLVAFFTNKLVNK